MKYFSIYWIKVLILLLVGMLSTLNSFATHNRAGEISFISKPLPNQPHRYEFVIVTYTKTGGDSNNADRDSLEILFGDGNEAVAPRISEIRNDERQLKRNEYRTTHNYSGAFSFYVASVEDPNRIDGIDNIMFGESVNIRFFIQDTLFLRDPQFFGYNSSPILAQPPIDDANVGQRFVHNPNAYDPDGDSLTFELITPLQARNNPVPSYQFLDQLQPSPSLDPPFNVSNVNLDAQTGEFEWVYPQREGIYNIAFLIREFRNGAQIGNLIRDMQIIVFETENRPPDVMAVRDTCIVIGDTVRLTVSATDPDVDQTVTLSAFGGPFEVSSPATFNPIDNMGAEVSSEFVWATECEHIFSQDYTVVFKAEDDFKDNRDTAFLVDLETWQLRLIAPPPQNLQATLIEEGVELTWDDYVCNTNKFTGFSIWRRVGCDNPEMPHCQQGLEGTDYIRLARGIQETQFIDETGLQGPEYSYRVVAEFADAFSASGFPINVSSGMPSINACIALPRDAPIITNVSVEATATTNGEIFVAWARPDGTQLDTIAVTPPPYEYVLFRADGLTNGTFEEIQRWQYDSFSAATDTTYLDQAAVLNTQDMPYHYKVAFYANGELVDETPPASSVFLQATGGDNQVQLTWEVVVPWQNISYIIYQVNDLGDLDSIGVSTAPNFVDEDLINGIEVCYVVEAIGSYGESASIPDSLINFSQEVCATPIDTMPPCAPELMVNNECESGELTNPMDNIFINSLEWTNPNESCVDDVIGYRIYYRSPLETEFAILEVINGANQTFYQHALNNTLAGCYAVSAIDSFQNESLLSNEVCLSNCSDYELPNVFTPNGDQHNDLFTPRNIRFVSSVDFKVFNRWGQIIFETSDPALNWDGTDGNTQEPVPEGVYYYGCEVFERTNDGIEIVNRSLSGYIHVVRGN